MKDPGWLGALGEVVNERRRSGRTSWLSRLRVVWLLAIGTVFIVAALVPAVVSNPGAAATWWVVLGAAAVGVAAAMVLSLPGNLRRRDSRGLALADEAGSHWLAVIAIATLPAAHGLIGVAMMTMSPLPFDAVAAVLLLIVAIPSHARVQSIDEVREAGGRAPLGAALMRSPGPRHRILRRHD